MDLLSEIKDLIYLEVKKVMKKQKEKRVIKVEHDHDDLEQYGRCLCVRLGHTCRKR